MKIATKTGDKGKTGLLFGGRHSKTGLVFDVLGDLDEASAMIGLVKSKTGTLTPDKDNCQLDEIQKDIIAIMGEINCSSKKEEDTYIEKYGALNHEALTKIDSVVEKLQSMDELVPKGWVIYGKTEISAYLDLCSKVIRRAERSYLRLKEQDLFERRDLIGSYINRLSDLFYLLARLEEI